MGFDFGSCCFFELVVCVVCYLLCWVGYFVVAVCLILVPIVWGCFVVGVVYLFVFVAADCVYLGLTADLIIVIVALGVCLLS